MSAENAAPAPADAEPKEKETLGSFAWFVVKLALAVFVFRAFFFSFYSIPSESMLPRLWNGDYFIAAKWPYGYSKWSMPFNFPPFRDICSAICPTAATSSCSSTRSITSTTSSG